MPFQKQRELKENSTMCTSCKAVNDTTPLALRFCQCGRAHLSIGDTTHHVSLDLLRRLAFVLAGGLARHDRGDMSDNTDLALSSLEN